MGAQFQVDEVSSIESSDISILWYLDFCGELGTGSASHGLVTESMKLHADRPTFVGRGVGEDECLILNARISRRHASMAVEKTGIRVKDLGSTNGTFVNGRQIEEAVISVGDVVTFDQVNFRVRRGLDLVNETEIIDFEQPLNAAASEKKDKASTSWLSKKSQSKSKDTAGLARARLATGSKDKAPSSTAVSRGQIQSRYSVFKPMLVGTGLAVFFFIAALYVLKLA